MFINSIAITPGKPNKDDAITEHSFTGILKPKESFRIFIKIIKITPESAFMNIDKIRFFVLIENASNKRM